MITKSQIISRQQQTFENKLLYRTVRSDGDLCRTNSTVELLQAFSMQDAEMLFCGETEPDVAVGRIATAVKLQLFEGI